ncbi:MAG: hypothetical protein LBD49_06260 [Oscillospiraceae bacterium]|jgi:hypothetical protein|nr:hypothetical protein [Oscillospiraceae bacterium]
MKLYIAIPDGLSPVLPPRFAPARMLYHIRGSRLCRARGGGSERGGIMVISVSGYAGGGPLSALTGEIEIEASKWGCEGVVLDAGAEGTRRRARLANRLASVLAPRPVFVPVSLGSAAPLASVLIQTAISGGSLYRHLADAAERFGASRLALECDRIRMDFALPCPGGVGEELGAGRFDELLSGAPRAFFSEALGVNYFYRREGSSRRVTLFDDAESIRRKLALAETFGIARAFLYYPRVSDILHEL